MIDTDKYEGHTPASWFPPYFGGEGLLDNKGRVMALLVYDEKEPQTSDEWLANAQLIADAPLLLEAYKRLRKELKEAEDVIQYALDRVGNDDDAKRVFEDFLEVIE